MRIENQDYKATIRDSVQLGRAMQRLLWSKSLDEGDFGFEYALSFVLFLRAERSMAAIRMLVGRGLCDDAMALVRVMVEKVITAEYILLVGMEPAMDFVQFHAISEWRSYQGLKGRNPSLVRSYTAAALKELEAAHDKATLRVMPDGSSKKRYGRAHDWTELSLLRRAEKVDTLLKERHSAASTCFMYDASYRRSANYLHASFASIARSISTTEDKAGANTVSGTVDWNISIRLRDTGSQVGIHALGCANVAAFQVLGFLSDVLKHSRSQRWVRNFARKTATDQRFAHLQKP